MEPPPAGRLRRANHLHLSHSIASKSIAYISFTLLSTFVAHRSPGIWAAGDVANAYRPILGTHVRLEHWSSALNQGPVAARKMLGLGVDYTKISYFFSDQYDLGLEYSGLATQWIVSCIAATVNGAR